ncbi:sulfate ABC transporter permease [Demequina gelatinilytica]|uniref:sulfate ABC transporter permease n=1 Tax=Demequina gelatinilytica TaxID=1638980 RepID=UPI001E3CCE67|nr:sulfate ABC transporter permease subunit [Demequina gelatinilytica]
MASVLTADGLPRTARRAAHRPPRRTGTVVLRLVVIAYLVLLVAWPVSLVFTGALSDGLGPVIDTFTDPLVLRALRLTAVAVLWAVVLNTVFGVGVALLLVRRSFPGRRLLAALVDLPLAVSPVVVGLALVLVYGSRNGWLGAPLAQAGVQIVFSTPGIVLATTFIAMPLVLREVVPVLEEVGTDQEQAARSLGAGPWATFRRITLPAIRWGVVYGMVLCLARAIGEFGAVKVVSGNLIGQTQTATLSVEELYMNFDRQGAFAVAAALSSVSIVVIIIVGLLRTRMEKRRGS